MNRAEYIIKVIHDANKADIISQRESVRVLTRVAELLNSGQIAEEIDNSMAMDQLWKDVNKRWGSKL